MGWTPWWLVLAFAPVTATVSWMLCHEYSLLAATSPDQGTRSRLRHAHVPDPGCRDDHRGRSGVRPDHGRARPGESGLPALPSARWSGIVSDHPAHVHRMSARPVPIGMPGSVRFRPALDTVYPGRSGTCSPPERDGRAHRTVERTHPYAAGLPPGGVSAFYAACLRRTTVELPTGRRPLIRAGQDCGLRSRPEIRVDSHPYGLVRLEQTASHV